MATVVRAWQVHDTSLQEIPALPAADQGLIEERLEDWLASEPDAIQDNLLIIGRQVNTGSGPLDLLGITVDGLVVVVELKRDRAPREVVAQAIDYASWVASLGEDDLREIARNYLQKDLSAAFSERFGQALPEVELQTPRVLVVASRLDAATERMIQYLSEKYEMDVDGLLFRYIKLASGEEILIRTSVVPEQSRVASSDSYRVTESSLLDKVRERNAVPVLRELRKIADFLWEEPVRTYGGSFRYWSDRMLCGVNAASNWGAPEGAIDVWVSHGHWAQATGLAEVKLMDELKAGFEFIKAYEGSHQMILRIKSTDQAVQFVKLLRTWRGMEAIDRSEADRESIPQERPADNPEAASPA